MHGVLLVENDVVVEGCDSDSFGETLHLVTGWETKPRGRRSNWMREAHMTRTAEQKARKNAEENESEEFCDMANGVREVDPTNYGHAMKCDQNDKWIVALAEDLQAIEDNGV